ncbi:MAG TPA: HAMP domain-containing sensor histidine kinase [Polyangiaceae bacterium]|nr:HAMP domain-containing sensor histidine kinase [Polyangiaceae bacterium]
MLVFRPDRSLTTANLAAVELLGLPSRPSTTGEAAGSADALDTLPDAVREAIERARDHVLSGRGDYAPSGFDPVVRIATKEGESVLLPRGTPIAGDDERVEGVNVMLRDVTGLQRFDQLRSDLVSTVAHELRTPLTSLQMAIGLCEEQVAGPLTDKQSQLLGAARQDCDRLRGMLGDLLDLARMEGGRLLLNRQAVSVSELIAAALEPHRMVAEHKGLRLQGDVATGLDSITADPERLQLVFTNLIGNALRHTSTGQVTVLAAATAAGAARFEVEDTGCGIDPAYHDQIFDKFFRPPGSEPGGAGLGLWIAREVVRAHGGDIGVHSKPGLGTTFWFELPSAA